MRPGRAGPPSHPGLLGAQPGPAQRRVPHHRRLLALFGDIGPELDRRYGGWDFIPKATSANAVYTAIEQAQAIQFDAAAGSIGILRSGTPRKWGPVRTCIRWEWRFALLNDRGRGTGGWCCGLRVRVEVDDAPTGSPADLRICEGEARTISVATACLKGQSVGARLES